MNTSFMVLACGCLWLTYLNSEAQTTATTPTQAPPKTWQIYFSPSGGCTEAVVSALNKAKTNVLVQAYSFMSAPIAKALVDAKRRGVNVQVVLDKSQRTEKYSSADFLRNSGVPTFIDTQTRDCSQQGHGH